MWIEYIHVIYITITENLVLLLNDTVVKLILGMKTLVDKYACVYFGKLPWKIGNHVRNRSWRYALFLYLKIHCFVASMYGKWFPWEFTMDTRAQRGETSMFGSLGMCRAHSFLRPLLLSPAWYRFMGSSNLKKTIQFHNLASLNRVAILLQFALNRVRIEGFQQHSPNKTSFKSSQPRRSFLPYT